MDALKKRRNILSPFRAEESEGSDVLASPSTTIPSSPSGSEGERHGMPFGPSKHPAKRSLSGRLSISESVLSRDSLFRSSNPRKLSKSRKNSASSFEVLNRRGSGFFEDFGPLSRTPTSLSSTSSAIDWKTQHVEGSAALGPDTFLRNKTPYLVVTSEYVVKLRNHADVMGLFPQLSEGPKKDTNSASTAAEPLVVIPVATIVSAFLSESTRPSFGFEIWWRSPASVTFHHASFFFNLPSERDDQMKAILRLTQKSQNETAEYLRYPREIVEPLQRIHQAEEPGYQHTELEIYPVVLRGNTRKDWGGKPDDDAKRIQETSSSYFVVGTHLCYLLQVHKEKSKHVEVICRHKSFGLVNLESMQGDWTPHQERFVVSFRDPFKGAVTLELASRYYRHIINALGKADRFLKPAWPLLWQTLEILRVKGLREIQYFAPREDYGGVKRTLDAYLAAYRCDPVQWEINWRPPFSPEFRLLPAKDGSTYSPLQLLAVLRTLRYNDYFHSLSFRDVDLTPLWNCYDHPVRGPGIAYLNRGCVALGYDEIEVLRVSPILHQEFHALAFCSETVRQIDLTNSFRTHRTSAWEQNTRSQSVQFLAPILSLLRSQSTKCDRLILSGNMLSQSDIVDLTETLETGAIQALDISHCHLDDTSLRSLTTALMRRGQTVQSLNLASNLGRLPSQLVPEMMRAFVNLKELNLCGALHAGFNGPLVPFEVLQTLESLEELDISKLHLNEATILDLEKSLLQRSQTMDQEKKVPNFRRLVLNSCGLNGHQAARLFDAIGEDHGVHLFISGNPLEHGIESLASSIRQSRGPAGLNMEMVEFKKESNYVLLLDALAETKHMSLLNLVGTAPTVPLSGTCGRETIRALENFFAHNQSIEFLDFSGFSGKLDDGQFAKGFGRSLIGLRQNKTLTHLRIRNQNLHDDAGTLGTVISENRTLMMFDCQDNNLNLTSLQFLAGSLKENTSIVEFPVSPDEKDRIWKNIVAGLHRGVSAIATSKAAKKASESQETVLRQLFQKTLDELDGYLARNRAALEEESGQVLEFDPLTNHNNNNNNNNGGTEEVARWPTLELKTATSTVAVAPRDDVSPLSTPVDALRKEENSIPILPDLDATPTKQPWRAAVRSAAVATNALPVPTLYRVPPPEDEAGEGLGKGNLGIRIGMGIGLGLGSVSEVPVPGSPGLPTPPEDDEFHKLIESFRESGFGSSF